MWNPLSKVKSAIDTLYKNQKHMDAILNDVQRCVRALQSSQGIPHNGGIIDEKAHRRLDTHHQNILAIGNAMNEFEARFPREADDDGK